MGLGTEKTGEGFYGILHSVQNAVQVTAKATRRVDQHEMYRRQKTEHSALGLSKHRAAPSSPERLWRRLGTYLRTEALSRLDWALWPYWRWQERHTPRSTAQL